jgi:Tfp pilus assembly protein PilF
MGQFEYDKAIGVFASLLKDRPEWDEVRVNLAMGYLNRQQEGDSERAMKLLEGVVGRRADFLAARYCRGILLLNAGKPVEALGEFRFVSEKDPGDAYAVYYVGQCSFSVQKVPAALEAYEKAIGIDSSLRSAYYGAFQCLQQMGRAGEAKERLAQFQAMKDDPRGKLVEFKYTRMGKKAEAMVVDLVSTGGQAASGTKSRPTGPVFAEMKPLPLINGEGLRWSDGKGGKISITAADIDGDGKMDLFLANALVEGEKTRNAILLAREKGFEVDVKHPLAGVELVNAVLWGDFDNDGSPDVYFCRKSGGALWRREKGGVWKDVTEATKTAGGLLEIVDGVWVDADHDGDLDLVLVRSAGPTELLNNNLDGTFRPIAKEAGVEGDGKGVVGVVAADLDGDGDVDLMMIKRAGPHEIYLNDRMWKYHKAVGFDDVVNARMIGAVAIDGDADGMVEIYGVSNEAAMKWSREKIGWKGERISDGGDLLAMVDVVGNGSMDVIVGDEKGWRHGRGAHGTADAWSVVNLEAEKGAVIVGFASEKGPVVWGAGNGRFPFLGMKVTGKENRGEQMRSNAAGIGVSAAARFDSKWASGSTFKNSSGPGQSLMPMAIGLGGTKRAGFVRIVWPDGLIQTELDLEAGKVHEIAETQRQTSSCPVIFVWDGSKFRFVTDCLGVAGLGFAVGRDEYAPVRPWENVLMPHGVMKAREGKYVVKLSEPMEEVCYLDSAALVRWELPAGWSMTVDERMGVNDPQPTGEARFYRKSMGMKVAKDDSGRDVTEILAKRDGRAVADFELDRRFVGFAKNHYVELEFADAIEGEAMIVTDGWIEYPYSQTMFAAWQAGVAYEAVTVEACGEDGKWVVVLDQVGYPAGMAREMSIPLPREKMPTGCRRLRLSTNQEIYWDRIFVAFAERCPEVKRVVMPLVGARLVQSGFAERKSGRRPDYEYSRRRPLWDTRAQEGFYTRLGEVRELVEGVDDAVVIFGPGEEVEMEFDSVPGDGVFVLEVKGWCKDKDLLTKDGETVGPVPVREGISAEGVRRREELHRRFNTRFQSGG